MSHPSFLAAALMDEFLTKVFDRFGPEYCVDCHLTVEPERLGEKRCLLCQRAFDDHMKECGD